MVLLQKCKQTIVRWVIKWFILMCLVLFVFSSLIVVVFVWKVCDTQMKENEKAIVAQLCIVKSTGMICSWGNYTKITFTLWRTKKWFVNKAIIAQNSFALWIAKQWFVPKYKFCRENSSSFQTTRKIICSWCTFCVQNSYSFHTKGMISSFSRIKK